jgi:hypothetical protein
MNLDPDGTLGKAFGIIYKKSKFDNFRILCIDAEQRGFMEAMEVYGEVALRLSAEITHDAAG